MGKIYGLSRYSASWDGEAITAKSLFGDYEFTVKTLDKLALPEVKAEDARLAILLDLSVSEQVDYDTLIDKLKLPDLASKLENKCRYRLLRFCDRHPVSWDPTITTTGYQAWLEAYAEGRISSWL